MCVYIHTYIYIYMDSMYVYIYTYIYMDSIYTHICTVCIYIYIQCVYYIYSIYICVYCPYLACVFTVWCRIVSGRNVMATHVISVRLSAQAR